MPESEANSAPLKGEGRITEDISSISREGDGVLYNAVHREPSAQRASKPIIEAIIGAKRMREASQEAGNDSKLRYALVTERAPFEFMLDEVRCRTLWPECVGFKDAIKVFDVVMFYEDFHMPPIIERRERCVGLARCSFLFSRLAMFVDPPHIALWTFDRHIRCCIPPPLPFVLLTCVPLTYPPLLRDSCNPRQLIA